MQVLMSKISLNMPFQMLPKTPLTKRTILVSCIILLKELNNHGIVHKGIQ